MKLYRPFLYFFLILSTISSALFAQDLATCIRFKAPEQKATITSPLCTLGVDTSCRRIINSEIRVRYVPPNSDTAIVVSIDKRTRPPFLYVWDMQKIPYQLFLGMGVLIEVTFSDGEVAAFRREGVFLTHQRVEYPIARSVSYELPGSTAFPVDTIRIASNRSPAFAQIMWNDKTLLFRIYVGDSLISSTLSEQTLAQTGIELLLDPGHKAKPYPTEDVMMYMVPLSGKPYRVTYTPQFSDSGNYRLDPSTSRSNFDCSIQKIEKKGYTVTLSIPQYLFGKSLPKEMGYNIIVKAVADSGKTVSSSLINQHGYNNYSPFLWGTLTISPRPLGKTRWIIWVATFLIGFAIPLLIYFIASLVRKSLPRVMYITHTKEEKQTFDRAKEVIDRQITRTDLTLQGIAQDLGITPKHLESTVKKVTGISFKNYIMYLRTEIVCERLRSSNASEISMAESCGFKNLNEMMRYFHRYHSMNPATFRKIQQVQQGGG